MGTLKKLVRFDLTVLFTYDPEGIDEDDFTRAVRNRMKEFSRIVEQDLLAAYDIEASITAVATPAHTIS